MIRDKLHFRFFEDVSEMFFKIFLVYVSWDIESIKDLINNM